MVIKQYAVVTCGAMLCAFRTSVVPGCPVCRESCMNLWTGRRFELLKCCSHRYRTDRPTALQPAPCTSLFPFSEIAAALYFLYVTVQFWSQLRPILTVSVGCTCVLQLHIVGHLTLLSPVVTICTTSLTFNNSTFCPHSVFMCFVWIWEQNSDYFPIHH